MALAPLLSIVGVFVYLGAFLVYNLDLLRGEASPSPSRATWTMWAILIVLLAISCGVMSHDWWKSLQLYGGIAANLVTCIFVWTKGGTSDFDRKNWGIISIALAAMLAWWLTRDATWGNLLLLGALLFSSVPLIFNVWSNPRAERPLPWMMFTCSYVLQPVVVVLHYKQLQDLATPAGATMLHLTVGLLALRRREPKPPD